MSAASCRAVVLRQFSLIDDRCYRVIPPTYNRKSLATYTVVPLPPLTSTHTENNTFVQSSFIYLELE